MIKVIYYFRAEEVKEFTAFGYRVTFPFPINVRNGDTLSCWEVGDKYVVTLRSA